MSDQEWEALFDKYIKEAMEDEQEQIKSHMLPTAIKIRGLVKDSITQSAANKAAEEGELPALPEPWIQNLDAPKGSQDHFAADQMEDYARQAITADRAARPVANKAEVEPWYMTRLHDMGTVYKADGTMVAQTYVKDAKAFMDAHNDSIATPPATTGASTGWQKLNDVQWMNIVNYDRAYESYSKDDAVHEAVKRTEAKLKELNAGSAPASTVLTDERINELECEFHDGLSLDVPALACAIEREVAAQAGQVAVPGWVNVDERLPDVPANDYREFIVSCKRANGKSYVFAAHYLNQKMLPSRWPDDDEPEEGLPCTGWHHETEVDGDNFFTEVCESGDAVTHWMPLPAAPSPAKESK